MRFKEHRQTIEHVFGSRSVCSLSYDLLRLFEECFINKSFECIWRLDPFIFWIRSDWSAQSLSRPIVDHRADVKFVFEVFGAPCVHPKCCLRVTDDGRSSMPGRCPFRGAVTPRTHERFDL